MKKVLMALIVVLLAIPLHGVEKSAREIIKIWDDQQSALDEKEMIKMSLINKSGKTRTRMLWRMIKTDEEGERKILISFFEPPEIKNMRLLMIENIGSHDDQFFYLPALRKVRRMFANNNKDHFAGSDLTFGDLKVEQMASYNYSLLKEETIENIPCYVIEAIPKTKEVILSTGYSKRLLWIAKDMFLDLKREYYDRNDRLLKTFICSDIIELKSKNTTKFRAKTITVENLLENHTTILAFKDITLDSGLKDSLFNKRSLMR